MTPEKETFISVLERNVTIECLCILAHNYVQICQAIPRSPCCEQTIFKWPSVVNLNIILQYLRVKKI